MISILRISIFIAFVVFPSFPAVLAEGGDTLVSEDGPHIYPEEACLAAGGHCVHESKCPEDKVNREVECSEQKSLGALCCHSAHPPGETRCELLAGDCKTECAEDLKVAQATNCAEGEVCCTLV